MPEPLRLQGIDLGRFRDLLLEAFTRERFAELLLTRLSRPIGKHSAPVDDDPTAFLRVLTNANATLWWRDILREARKAIPTDPNLLAFAEEIGEGPVTVKTDAHGDRAVVSGRTLQLQIDAAQTTYDIVTWRRKLGEIESRVCRIEYPAAKGIGTAFLVGPDLVMTNYHVIEQFLANPALVPQIVVRFDYKVLADGVQVEAGKPYSLAADWLVEKQPYSARDSEIPPGGDPAPDELDFALLRVQGTPGIDPVGGDTGDPRPVPRHWITVRPSQHDFMAKPAIYIVQHPDGKPMQIAIDSHAVVGLAGNGTRVRYRTTTEHGSSGSPCFNADWELVAVHHAGDPKYLAGLKPEFNQGVPITAIWNWMTAHGRAGLFGNA
jgi:hypothetical protein